ncbi:MAG: hypothetical protein QG635_312 [Bacteroidota bacterium]|nr:hypothetical protein [Bacteroidota bacterium]
MLSKYINKAIRYAKYELLTEDNSIYGEIPHSDINKIFLMKILKQANLSKEEWISL